MVRDLRLGLKAERSGFRFIRKSYKRRGNLGASQFWYGDSGQDDAPLVFFVHGTGNDGLFPHEPLFLALMKAGIDIFTFDLDGHGAGNSTALKPESLKSCLDDAHAQAARFQKGSLVGLGYSLGGALLMTHLVHSETGGFDAAIFVSVPESLRLTPVALVAESLSLLSPGFYRHVGYYGLGQFLPAIGSFRRRAFPVRIHQDFGVQADYPYLIQKLIAGMQLFRLAPGLSCPSLFCYGGADFLVPAAQGKSLADLSPDSRYLLLSGETHFTTPLSQTFEKEMIHWILRKTTTPDGMAKQS